MLVSGLVNCVLIFQECGSKLEEVTPKGLNAVFDTLRSILHSDRVASRVQDMIEVLYAIRKDRFKVNYICVR